MWRLVFAVSIAALLVAQPMQPVAAAPLSPDTTLTFQGHGWGHGRGMGQWGARGMADGGSNAAQILSHYYASISFGGRPPEDIRVLLEESPDVIVTTGGTLQAAWSDGTPIAASGGFFRVSWNGSAYVVDHGSAWTGPWSAVGSSGNYVVFSPASANTVELVRDDGSTTLYAGNILARYSPAAPMRAINDTSMQEYLYGVVPREMPSSFPQEALRAQAIAGRSYAAYRKDDARAKGTMFDICITTCQSFGGYARRPYPGGPITFLQDSNTRGAVEATAGSVLLYAGRPILAEYSSSTGGYSAGGTVPYEQPVPDPSDSVSPHHNWSATVRVSDVLATWPQLGQLNDLRVTKRNGFADWGGRVLSMELVGTNTTVTLSGAAFRLAFSYPGRSDGIRSDWFVLTGGAPSASSSAPPPSTPPPAPAPQHPTLVGVVRGNVWYVRMGDGRVASFSWGYSSDVPIVGDWNGDGIDTPGVVRGTRWYLSNGFSGHVDISFNWGRSGDRPVVGDWNGDGIATPGVVRGTTWYLSNRFAGPSEFVFSWGRSSDIPVAGDWNGDGIESPGLVRDTTWFLSNNFIGRADLSFGMGRSGDRPIVGDWNADRVTTVGVVRGNTWYLNNGFDGFAEEAFGWARSSDRPVTGRWG